MPFPKLPLPSPYEWTARLKPALLTLAPIFVLLAIWLPAVWTALGALAGLLGACGVTYLLAQVARARGKALEARFAEDGPALTTALLRHADDRIDPLTKQRYHAVLASRGLSLPSSEEEALDAASADRRYKACATWLLEATRDEKKFKLLLQENTAYGFRRNLLAMKPLALVIILAALVANALAVWLTWSGMDEQAIKGLILEGGLAATLAIWLTFITRSFFAEASLAYGKRLLASCDLLDRSMNDKPKGKRKSNADEA